MIGEPVAQVGFAVLVHEKADGAPVHAIDGLAEGADVFQRLEHETVAAEGDDHVGVRGVALTVQRRERFARLLCHIGAAGQESY